jgi:hypothetical protein
VKAFSLSFAFALGSPRKDCESGWNDSIRCRLRWPRERRGALGSIFSNVYIRAYPLQDAILWTIDTVSLLAIAPLPTLQGDPKACERNDASLSPRIDRHWSGDRTCSQRRRPPGSRGPGDNNSNGNFGSETTQAVYQPESKALRSESRYTCHGDGV